MRTCTTCEVEEGIERCPLCGTRLTEGPSGPPAEDTERLSPLEPAVPE